MSLFENDGLFYTKQRVVFYEHSETAKVLPVIENSFDSLIGDNKIQTVKKSIFNLFARTRTHTVQEFLHFCCHKCHTITYNTLMDRQLRTFLRYISTMRLFNYQIFDDKTEINTLFPPSFMRNTLLSSLIFHLECDTCDSKKTTSLLEDARYAYAREPSAISFISISTSLRRPNDSSPNLLSSNSKTQAIRRKFVTFLRFFPSLGQYLPIYL